MTRIVGTSPVSLCAFEFARSESHTSSRTRQGLLVCPFAREGMSMP